MTTNSGKWVIQTLHTLEKTHSRSIAKKREIVLLFH